MEEHKIRTDVMKTEGFDKYLIYIKEGWRKSEMALSDEKAFMHY